jgi:hypothetical protein
VRLSEDHTVCTEVCDAQEPAAPTLCAREIDPTASPNTAHRGMGVLR